MNASDVINAVGSSPGFIVAMTGALPLTYTYTAASQTVELQINGTCTNSILQINSVTVSAATSGGVTDTFDIRIPIAKGQSITITMPSSSGSAGNFAVWARSLR